MFEILEKIKAELMILGFISLLLTFVQDYAERICIPESVADTMLPCKKKDSESEEHRRRRFLAGAAGSSTKCLDKGLVPLISVNGLHQLHILIFILAAFHVFYSAITMALGRAKIRGWKNWEEETKSQQYAYTNDPSVFRLAHEVSFVRRHTQLWNKNKILLYITSFFRQFFWSVRKTDYMTMRHGFINAHMAPNSKFDFQKYIKRSLEDDFKEVVSISWPLWISFILLLLLNVNSWDTLFWCSFIPLVVALAVGTKLQAIITKLAFEIEERHVIVQGAPLVTVSDDLFWFGKPKLVLTLIHFTLFQNAFQIIYFFWIWYSFGLHSCFHEDKKHLITRMCLGVGVQVLVSYVTLPLYALVSQMGSVMKTAIFNEETVQALKNWQKAAKTRKSKLGMIARASPANILEKIRSMGSPAGFSRRKYNSDSDLAETEMLPSPALENRSHHHQNLELGQSSVDRS